MLRLRILKTTPAAVLAFAMFASPPVAVAANGPAQLGVYEGAGCTGRTAMAGFVSWFGTGPQRVLDFVGAETWSAMAQNANWSLGCWKKTNYQVTLSVPMLPGDTSATLAKGATGLYNPYFAQLASTIIANGYGNAVIRLGWEFNGGWYRWAAAKDPQSWIAYWRQIVTTMRAVPGAHFQFDWTSGVGWLQIVQPKVYPGDDVVDIIGMDIYDQSWDPKATTPDLRWQGLVTENYGLNWLVSFAAQHHKPISIPEWGAGTRPDGHGGGDDPLFINNMAAFIQINNVVYDDYWDYKASDYNAKLSNGQFPNAGAAFLKAFRSGH